VPVSSTLRDAVLSLAPTPEQEPWSGAAVQTLPDAEADPRRHPFVILDEHGEAAGFFVLDETPSPADPSADLVLRAFFVDQGHQRQGLGGRALVALPELVARELPSARTVVLTVNVRNQVGRRLYLRHGFSDTGQLPGRQRRPPARVTARPAVTLLPFGQSSERECRKPMA